MNWIYALFSLIIGLLPFQEETADVVIYGGTSAGIIAAVQVSQMGKSVILIEPSNHLGGMTSGGLGWVDVGKPATIGGLAKEFFYRLWKYYQQDEHWIWEKKHIINGQHGPLPDGYEETMWVFEPHVAKEIFSELLDEHGVKVLFSEKLDRIRGVIKQDLRITAIKTEAGKVIRGKMFVDASYEGDLMAATGVSYNIGRESNALFAETYNGLLANLKRGDMQVLVDPYINSGIPESGLLSRIHPDLGGFEGDGDRGIQAYNYRMCLTDVEENKVPIEKPENYDEGEYELVFRAIEAGLDKRKFFKLDLLPNRKTDSNNNGAFSTDYVGMSWNYANANHSDRIQIALAHEEWQRGLVWTLQNHPRVSDEVREYYAPWGLAKDEFVDTDHWPHQLYIREARRMVSDYMITEHTALGQESVLDGIGLGSYHIDSHAIKYFVASDGYIATDGCLYNKVPVPFPIGYRAVVPKRNECENLLVPVCLSVTHAAYGAIRMEPVFMVLGQSTATAASLAIDLNTSVQDLPYEILKERLVTDGQIIDWN